MKIKEAPLARRFRSKRMTREGHPRLDREIASQPVRSAGVADLQAVWGTQPDVQSGAADPAFILGIYLNYPLGTQPESAAALACPPVGARNGQAGGGHAISGTGISTHCSRINLIDGL